MKKRNELFEKKVMLYTFLTIAVLMPIACATISPCQQYINSGQQHFSKGEYKQAINNYDKAVELEPQNAMYYEYRALAFKLLGDSDRAIADYSKALELIPTEKLANSYSVYMNIGSLYTTKGDYDQAISAYTKAIQALPTPTTWWHLYGAYFDRSRAYAFKDDIENAILDRKRAQELVKAEELAKPTFGRQLAGAALGGFVGGVVGGTTRAVAGPSTSGVDFMVADAVERDIAGQKTFDPNKVQQTNIERRKFSNVDYAEIYEIRAHLRSSRKDRHEKEKAIADYSKALELNPTGKLAMWIYLGRAEVYVAMNEHDNATSDSKKASEIISNTDLFDDKFVAYGRLGLIYLAIGDYDQAISDFTKGIEIASFTKVYRDRIFIFGKRHLYFGRGLAYSKKGDSDRAIADYSQALNKSLGNSRWGEVYYYRALAYYAKGEYSRAERDVKEALKLKYQVDPDFLTKLNSTRQ